MDTFNYHLIFHEIKNTATLINSSIQLLSRKCPQLKSEPYWNNIKQEVNYLKAIILEISQADVMKPLQKEPLDLNSLLPNICNCINDTFPNLQWDMQLDKNLPIYMGDNIKLRQAVLNLIKNSAEAQGAEGGQIIISTCFHHPNIQISITDFGGGIPAELEETLFQPFVTSKKHGTGLGLAIAQQIIECHNGTLLFENHPNESCTFTIHLPVLPGSE